MAKLLNLNLNQMANLHPKEGGQEVIQQWISNLLLLVSYFHPYLSYVSSHSDDNDMLSLFLSSFVPCSIHPMTTSHVILLYNVGRNMQA